MRDGGMTPARGVESILSGPAEPIEVVCLRERTANGLFDAHDELEILLINFGKLGILEVLVHLVPILSREILPQGVRLKGPAVASINRVAQEA